MAYTVTGGTLNCARVIRC